MTLIIMIIEAEVDKATFEQPSPFERGPECPFISFIIYKYDFIRVHHIHPRHLRSIPFRFIPQCLA